MEWVRARDGFIMGRVWRFCETSLNYDRYNFITFTFPPTAHNFYNFPLDCETHEKQKLFTHHIRMRPVGKKAHCEGKNIFYGKKN